MTARIRPRWLVALIAAGLLGAACGSTAPTPTSIAGSWSGTLQATGSTASTITFSLSQSGGAVSGSWQQTAGPSVSIIGTLTGTVTGSSFSGTMKYTLNGATCSANLTGPASTTSMTWTSAGFTGCGAGAAFTVAITKK